MRTYTEQVCQHLQSSGGNRHKVEGNGDPKNHKKHPVDFIVVKENLMPVLGAKDSQLMGLLTIHSKNFKRVAEANSSVDVINQYKDVFVDELGV